MINGVPSMGLDDAQAEIFKCVDAERRIHLRDTPIGEAKTMDFELRPSFRVNFATSSSSRGDGFPNEVAETRVRKKDETTPYPATHRTDQAEDKEVGMSQCSQFSMDGSNGPVGRTGPQIGKNRTKQSFASQKEEYHAGARSHQSS